jgi:DNA polymerase-3 subunit delta'
VTDAVPPWWGEPWRRLEARWIRARRTGTLLVEASVGLGGDEFSRRLCAALLCLETESERPCARCAACRLGAAGTHPDFHGPSDAATRYGIDDLRGWLIELARRPVVSARTVLWLPAADRLGLAAASALLKTLEEPPEDAVLILSARNARALPPT